MPELSVTEEQLERLEALRAELEATFVDGYGHVRRRDAVDYLFDTHTPPAEERVRRALDRRVRDGDGTIDYPALQSVARNTEGVKGSGMPAEEMYAAVLEARVEELEAGRGVGLGAAPCGGSDEGESSSSPGTDTDRGDADESDEGSDGTNAPDDHDSTEEESEPADAADEGIDANDEDGDAGGATDEDGSADPAGGEGSGSSGDVTASSNGGGSPLQTMMNLLRTHDDKWRKASSGDAPYEVDLPDGGTEAARTKDDVKRILFRNY